jgi:hypothetical protein
MIQQATSVRFLEYILLIIYTIFVSIILISTNAPVLGVAVVMFLAPLLIIWQRVDMRSRLLAPLSLIAIAATVVIQSFAYRYDLWKETTPTDILMFGTGPLEVYVFACLLILYFVVMYEYMFDDHKNSLQRGFGKAMQVGVLSMLLAVSFGYVITKSTVLIENAFFILIGFLSFGLVALGSVRYQLLDRTIFRKSFLFASAMLPVSLMVELVLLSNGIRVYDVSSSMFLYTIEFFSFRVPLEEVALLLLLPMWIVVVYELCVDDGR